ncbi:MAG: DUF692 family multinuclear iron-containing protein [Chloroflexota bacterium]
MPPQLAAVYSPALMGLLAQEPELVDRIVICSWHTQTELKEARAHRPLVLHGMPAPFALNQPDPFALMGVEIEQRLALAQAAWFSMSLVGQEENEAEPPELQPQSQLFLHTCRNALRLKQRLPAPLLLENVGCEAASRLAYACEPLFITAVLDAVDCGFVLNVAHARLSAHNLSFDEERYFRSLPLFRVREIRVSGPQLENGALIDAHGPLQEQDWRALAFVLARTQPQILTLEYVQDQTLLRQQLDRLRALLQV